jgi:Tol biopolymer transport system component
MTRVLSIFLAAAIVVAAPRLVAQSGNDLFQKALSKERAEGQLDEAIQIYSQIVKDFASDRPLAAKALLQLGRCFEKLGRADARTAYERVVREYSDQTALVVEARARLATAAGSSAKPDGPLARRLWADPAITLAVAMSPDQKLVTFADWETGDLAVRDLTTGRSRRLTAADGSFNEWAEYSAFSPDAKQVAYSWFKSAGTTHYQLRIIPLAGGTPRVLYDNPDVEYVQPAAWVPDGKAILVLLQRHDRSAQIALISTLDGTARVLKTLDWRGPAKISLSPDGRWIAYDAPAGAETINGDIFLLETSGAREVVLVRHAANDLNPVWTPDGRGVVFTSDRTGAPAVWLARVTDGRPSGEPVLVKSDLGRRNFPLGFAGGAYVYAIQTGGTDVSVAALDPDTALPAGAPDVVSERFVGTNASPGWSADGSALAFVSDRGARYAQLGGRTLVIHSIASGEQRELFVPMTTFRTPIWSPDRSSLLLVGRDDKAREGLYRFDIAGGVVTPIVRSEPGLYVNWADWMPDGRDVIYSGPSGAGGQLVRRNIAAGAEQVLFRGNVVRSLAVSPDGTRVVFHERGLKLVSTTGGAVRDLFGGPDDPGIPGFRGLAWTANGRYVVFPRVRTSTAKDQRVELWRVNVESGAAEPTGLVMEALRDFALDRSGRRLAYSAGARRFEIWAVEQLLPPAERPATGRR